MTKRHSFVRNCRWSSVDDEKSPGEKSMIGPCRDPVRVADLRVVMSAEAVIVATDEVPNGTSTGGVSAGG